MAWDRHHDKGKDTLAMETQSDKHSALLHRHKNRTVTCLPEDQLTAFSANCPTQLLHATYSEPFRQHWSQ